MATPAAAAELSTVGSDAEPEHGELAGPAQYVSVILPVHNGESWIDSCLGSLLRQSVLGQPEVRLQLSAFDDGSSDGTWAALQRWVPRCEAAGVGVVLGRSGAATGGGCGFAKNRAVAQSSGEWLCFQDVDDDMMPTRIELQLAAARQRSGAIVGSRVRREPEGSTARYTAWANGMCQAELALHRFRECTLLMPTWFMARSTFEAGAPCAAKAAAAEAGGRAPSEAGSLEAFTSDADAASCFRGAEGAPAAGGAGFREVPCEDLLFLQACACACACACALPARNAHALHMH